MRFGRLTLSRRKPDTTTVVALRILNLIVGRDGGGASGSATYPRTANIAPFSSHVLVSFESTAAIVSFATTVAIPAFKSTAPIPPRRTTATELWLTSP